MNAFRDNRPSITIVVPVRFLLINDLCKISEIRNKEIEEYE